jgi:hypothetical protein
LMPYPSPSPSPTTRLLSSPTLANLPSPPGIERTVSGYGSKISGQGYTPSGKALPSTARKPAVKRSNSTPAPSTSSKALGGSKTPLGTNKYPGGKAPGAAAQKKLTNGAAGAQKQITNGVGGAKSTVGGAKSTVGGATKGVTGGVVGGANKALTTGKGVTGGVVGGATNTVGPYGRKPLPKPYLQGPNLGSGAKDKDTPANSGLPKPYNPAGGTSYSNANSSSYNNPYPEAKKTAVRPGQSKPFKAPGVGGGAGAGAGEESEKKPYPGTNTLPGTGGKTPVNARKQRYKPAERMKGTAEMGKAVFV